MNRRQFLGAVGSAAIMSRDNLSSQSLAQTTGDTPEEIYKRAYAIDAMCFAAEPPRGYVQYLTGDKILALKTSGITAMAMNMTAGYDELSRSESLFAAVKDRIQIWDRFVIDHQDVFKKIVTVADLEDAKESGHVGVIFCFQMSAPFGWDLAKLKSFSEMGVRQIQLVDGRRNYLADSCWEPSNAGLSQFGFEAVEAMNANRIIVDLSHVGEQSALDAILTSKQPVIFSHSGCYALCPHPRNVSDRNIRAMADQGGVFCIYNQSGWLTTEPVVSIDHYLSHVTHVINLVGEDHVGVGTDQDAVDMTAMRPNEIMRHQESFKRRRSNFPQLTWTVRHMRVPELSHPKRLFHLANAMHEKGYMPRVIEKVLGGNYRRAFNEVIG